ncbi:MAG: hypothetical protein JWO88_2621, partial [Frankiales bacterium]|nr:hypothetical protein [Frankiales bacterium]
MAIGQAVLPAATLDVAAVDRLTARMDARETNRHVTYAAQLTDALALDRVYADAGMQLQTSAVLALVLNCSEDRAAGQLREASFLDRLGALAAMRAGMLTVEQSRVVVNVLGSVDDDDIALSVWSRLQRRLEQDAAVGAVLPPARTSELLRRWLIEVDAQAAVARRRDAARQAADVELWRRDDGLVDLALRGLTGPNARACAQRIRDHATPIGSDDPRSAGERALDAAVDLILGRTRLPYPAELAELDPDRTAGCGRPGCGCAQGQPVPCGTNVQVLVPLPSALGTSDEPAELVGHGPIEPDLLQALLLAEPVLTRVWVDRDSGIPVAIDDRTWTPGRGDPDALREALLDIASGDPPGERVPSHPDDHLDEQRPLPCPDRGPRPQGRGPEEG